MVQDSLDEKIAAMQERKNLEIDSAIEAQYRASRLTTKELLALFSDDMEKDSNGDPVDGPHEEPFIFTKDPYYQEMYPGV